MKDSNIIFRFAQNPEDTKVQEKIWEIFWSDENFLSSVQWVVWKILRINYEKTKKQE